MSQPSVAIVVVTYNCGAFIEALAASLHRVTYSNYRLCIVDSASTDGSAGRLADVFPAAEVIQLNANRGFAAGVNAGLARCLADNPDYVLLLNPDCTVAPDFLDNLVSGADAATIVVPALHETATGKLVDPPGDFNWRGRFIPVSMGRDSASSEIDVASFCCVLIPTAVFGAIGPLDEGYGMYYEDTEYCLRARKAGFRIAYRLDSLVHHVGGASSGGPANYFKVYYGARNRPQFVLTRLGALRFACFIVPHLLRRSRSIVGEYLHGDRGLSRVYLLALRDFLLRRRGMTYQPADFADYRPPA